VQIRKAVITAAGRGVRLYPASDTVQKSMLPVVDRDGLAKPVIQIIAEEALESGIEEVCIVCAPGDDEQYLRQLRLLRDNPGGCRERQSPDWHSQDGGYAGMDWAREQAERIDRLVRRLRFAVQEEPRGYGHAVYCAKEFVGDESFLLLLGDHLYVSEIVGRRCAQQLIALAEQEGCAAAAVQATREHLVGRYGTLSGKRIPNASGVYQIERIIEKPSVSTAELELQTPGLRMAHYLCFFGMHVLPQSIFEIIEEAMQGKLPSWGSAIPETQLTPALQELAKREKYLAIEVSGARYDIGGRFGLLQTQIALGLAGKDRDAILRILIELLAEAPPMFGVPPSGGRMT